jgi:hypothetical protein
VLLRDAVADHHGIVAVMEENILRASRWRQRQYYLLNRMSSVARARIRTQMNSPTATERSSS